MDFYEDKVAVPMEDISILSWPMQKAYAIAANFTSKETKMAFLISESLLTRLIVTCESIAFFLNHKPFEKTTSYKEHLKEEPTNIESLAPMLIPDIREHLQGLEATNSIELIIQHKRIFLFIKGSSNNALTSLSLPHLDLLLNNMYKPQEMNNTKNLFANSITISH